MNKKSLFLKLTSENWRFNKLDQLIYFYQKFRSDF